MADGREYFASTLPSANDPSPPMDIRVIFGHLFNCVLFNFASLMAQNVKKWLTIIAPFVLMLYPHKKEPT
jgi:hypothetical protein